MISQINDMDRKITLSRKVVPFKPCTWERRMFLCLINAYGSLCPPTVTTFNCPHFNSLLDPSYIKTYTNSQVAD